MNRNRAEKTLLSMLDDNFDSVNGVGPAVQSNQASLSRSAGNPAFRAQFDLDVNLFYFTEAAGVYTSILPAALDATLQTRLAVFFFGQSDFDSGFAALKQEFPLSIWTYGIPFIFGTDEAESSFSPWDATVSTNFRDGDLVIPFEASPAGTNTLGLVRLRCNQVAYGTLLGALSSDTFRTNMVRYIISDTALIAQFNNTINIFTLSLFGKFGSDSVNPNSFKLPEQFQNGIIDVPIKKGIDKHASLGTFVDYDVTAFSWQVFVPQFNKLTAAG